MFKRNPKLIGSGIIECIPQEGECPVGCKDCFFQSGRSYIEPLSENLPHIPSLEMTKGKVVRMNDGNDSNIQRELVMSTAEQFDDYFYNTSIPRDIEGFKAPVVLTVNPAEMTDKFFHKLSPVPSNLMFVRVRVNMWNLKSVVEPAIHYYTDNNIPVVLTFMSYYNERGPEDYKDYYEFRQRVTNSYWCLKIDYINKLKDIYKNKLVYYCDGVIKCKDCGNCLREYYMCKEKMGCVDVNG